MKARGLNVAPRSASDAGGEALRALAVALAPLLRELLEVDRRNEALVDVVAFVPGPKRVVMNACRSGEIIGAACVGRRWIAPRASIEAWLRTLGPRVVPVRPVDRDDLDDLRESLAATRARGGR